MTEAIASTPMLSVQGARKEYPGVIALDDASLEIDTGMVEGLVGKNGAGKSTLIKVITGVEEPDAGSIRLAGEEVTGLGVRAGRDRGIVAVSQEASLFRGLSVTENLLMPDRYPRVAGRIEWGHAHEIAREALRRLAVDVDPRTVVERLSVPRQRSVMIAKALIRNPRLLILDEPTEAFTEREVDRLFEILRTLAQDGVTVLYVSHRLEEVIKLADHITVVRDGRTVARLPGDRVDRAALVDAIVGKEFAHAGRDQRSPSEEATGRPPILSVRSVSGTRVRGASIVVRPGEVVGLYGLTGSGRSELLRLVAGAAMQTGGAIEFDGRSIARDSLRRRRARGILFFPEDRAAQGVLPQLTVRENVSVGARGGLGKTLMPGRLKSRERTVAAWALDAVGTVDLDLERSVSTLSGGNQQKVLLARGLASGARLWLLDEPTVGLDVAARADLFATLRQVAQGKTGGSRGAQVQPPGGVIVAMSDYEDIAAVADRIYVLSAGRVVCEFAAEDITEERLLHAVTFGAAEGDAR